MKLQLTFSMSFITHLFFSPQEIEWWIKFRNPHVILQKHESYLFCEVMFYVAGFLTFCHGKY